MKLVIRLFFRYFFRTIRIILGPFMLLWEKLTTPKGIERDPEDQKRLDEKTRNFTLYQFKTCPFCIKARKAINGLSLNIEKRDAQHDQNHREELLKGGGKIKVPCLRVAGEDGKETWLYDSSEIIQFLKKEAA